MNHRELSSKILKMARNRIYFKYKALSPALYRMPVIEMPETFGTDANYIYASPINVIMAYKELPEEMIRTYMHTIFHCIYLHPFLPTNRKSDLQSVWELALDICCENAVLRLTGDDFSLPEDGEKKRIMEQINENVKLCLPELVYQELQHSSEDYNLELLSKLFKMDDHLWLHGNSDFLSGMDRRSTSKKKQKNSEDNSGQDNNQTSEKNDPSEGKDEQSSGSGEGEDKDNINNEPKEMSSPNGNTDKENPTDESEKKDTSEEEWKDISQKIACDLEAFHKEQGREAGDMIQEISYLVKDKEDYAEFLKNFAVLEEVMALDLDEFDLSYYTYGLNMEGKKKLLIEPLEYKDTLLVKEFVIAIDTSGSVQGDLVERFLRKTYSILKDTESFSEKVNIHIIQCDAQVQTDTKIENLKELEEFLKNMKLYGFGGTDFRPVFSYVEELEKKKEFTNLQGLLYFTDGYGTYPIYPTRYKTAFVFLEDYDVHSVPSWAMQVSWKDSEE